MLLLVLALLALFLLLSAVFSGSETGVYSISRLQLDAEARHGSASARLLQRLLRQESLFLITLLIGNNLMLELLTHVFEDGLLPDDLPGGARELLVTLSLTPVVFLFAELLPKDAFRRRPHRFLFLATPLLLVARALFLPLSLPIYALSRGLERLFGLRSQAVSSAFRREEMLEILEEGTRTGALTPEAQELARNVLVLRETPVRQVMVPWERVRTLDLDQAPEEGRARVEEAEFTRLPAVRAVAGGEGQEVVGYVHQLDVLTGDRSVAECLRELPRLAASTPIDRALTTLRRGGQRVALVGQPGRPRGLVTLMDLVAAISRESRGPRARARA